MGRWRNSSVGSLSILEGSLVLSGVVSGCRPKSARVSASW